LLTTLPCISGGLISSRGQEPSAQHPASIEALNYMVSRGWEFVQAYVSGNEHQTTHFLLRRASSCLSDTEKRLLLAEPRTHKEAPEKRKKGKQQEKEP